MNWNTSTIESLRRVFTEGFAARDIAEPLLSFDAGSPVSEFPRLWIVATSMSSAFAGKVL